MDLYVKKFQECYSKWSGQSIYMAYGSEVKDMTFEQIKEGCKIYAIASDEEEVRQKTDLLMEGVDFPVEIVWVEHKYFNCRWVPFMVHGKWFHRIMSERKARRNIANMQNG